MFIEPHFGHSARHPAPTGWIEVICGSMFSGKTEELIRRLRRAQIARQRVEIFKPTLDKRYNDTDIVSHSALTIRSTPISGPSDMLLLAGSCEVVGIDEAQFFDESVVEICTQLANRGARVIVAGLDMDYEGRPFGPMPALMATAEFVTKVHAICARCGAVASYSYRLSAERKQVLLGEKQDYEPRCRACFRKGQTAGRTSPTPSVQNTPPPSL